MRHVALLVCMSLVALPALAKDKMVAISPTAAAKLNGKVLAVVRHERPPFLAMTPGRGAFALLGALAAFQSGKELVEKNGIEDPAYIFEQQLAPALATNYSMKLRQGPAAMLKGSDKKTLKAAFPDADYALTVASINWGYQYLPLKFGHYSILYGAVFTLNDVKTGQKLAEFMCFQNTSKHDSPPDGDQILANRAQLVKDETAALAWDCMDRGAAKTFGIPQEWLPRAPPELADPLAHYAVAKR